MIRQPWNDLRRGGRRGVKKMGTHLSNPSERKKGHGVLGEGLHAWPLLTIHGLGYKETISSGRERAKREIREDP